MTREEEIKQASQKYPKDSIHTAEMEYYAFMAGARWADNNPKSPWVSVKDRLPNYPESEYDIDNMYLVCREGGSLAFVAIFRRNGKWYIYDHMQATEIIAPDYWMPMPDVPKGGEV